MASVYAVRLVGARGFERIVVMKRVHPHLLDNREFREMFIDEASISSTVKHPNIVHVIDVVEEAGELFLIMEYVESVSLAQLLRSLQGETLPPAIVSRIMCDVLSGLQAAHDAVDLRGQPMNIVHRDVSPQNIIVGTDGTSRLIDFGIAKAASRLTPTTTGALKGKFGYMAPEQIRQQPVDRRVDVFAAGVVLHETLTSRRLFGRGDEADALLSVLVRDVPDPSSLVPELPAGIDAIVHRALARDREERFASASELSADLERACPPASPRDVAALVARTCAEPIRTRREDLHAALDRLPASTGDGGASASRAPLEVDVSSEEGGWRSRRALLGGLGAVAVVTAGALIFAVTRAGRPEDTPGAPASLSAAASVATTSAPSSSEPDPSASTSPPSVSAAVASSQTAPRAVSPQRPAKTAKPSSDIHKTNPYLDHR
jgi:serine/threonine-protein kinase